MNVLRLAAWRAVLLGLISALLMIVSIVLRGEIWNSRTITLVILWLLSGILGTFGSIVVLLFTGKMLGARPARVLGAVIFLPAFIAAGAVGFYLQTGWQTGFELHPEHPIRSALLGTVQIMAFFIYTVSSYMLPWMAPAMIIAGYALTPKPPLTPGG